MDSRRLLSEIESLPPLKRIEAEDFIEFLASREESRLALAPMSFSWAGGLAELTPEFTSRQLKKQAMNWIAPDAD